MPRKTIPRDPIAAYQRKTIATRRIGPNAKCACGEVRPLALIAGSRPVLCIEGNKQRRGISIMEKHHIAGRNNSPETLSIPANDHAELSEDQRDWPKETLENRDGSPLLKAAACMRGFIDLIRRLIDRLVGWVPELLETLDDFLYEKLGPKWWIGTPVENVVPQRGQHA